MSAALSPRRLLALALPPLGAVALVGLGCSRSQADATGAAKPLPSLSASGLSAGSPAPEVTFAVHTGESVSLRSLRGKPVIVYFYPKDDTPGCTVEAQEIRDLYEELKRTGVVVIGVSTDGRDSHRAFAEKHALPFLLASDESGELAKTFGVALKNGRSTRVSFVIGADGKVKRVFSQVTPKGHAAELLAALSS